MHEMFAWYIDNNAYISKEFIDQLIADKEAADAQGITIRSVILNRSPDRGNPSAAITGARNAGLLGKNEEYSDALRLYKAGIYPLSMLLFEIAAKRNVAKSEPIPMKPLVCLCKIFSYMNELGIAESELFITTAEVYEYISIQEDYSGITKDLVQRIVDERVYTREDLHIPDKRVTVRSEVYLSMLFSMLCGTPVFKHGGLKTVLSFEEKYVELIDYIAQEGERISNAPIAEGRDNSNFYDYCMDINNGIMEIIPEVPFKAGITIPKGATKDIFDYLFGVHGARLSNWGDYFEYDCAGLYRIFYPIRWIALVKVFLQDKTIGEYLLDYVMQANNYIDSLKEGKLMIELPFENTNHSDISELTKCDPLNNEAAFKKWVAKLRKANGEPYSENYRNQFVSALKAAGSAFADAVGPFTSVFEIDEAEVFERVLTAIKCDSAFEEFNRSRGNGALSAGLDLYKQFLLEKDESTNDMFTPEWFKEKAKEYPDLDAEANALLADFQAKFAPEYLASLSNVEMLNAIFLNAENAENVCRVLEFGPKIKDTFGSIKGGNAYKYGLYYSTQGAWMTGSHQKPRKLTEQEAIEVGTKLRDHLVAGANAVKEYGPLNSLDDYKKLYKILRDATEGDIERVWFLKYYQMLYPELFATNYSEYAQRTVLGTIGEEKEKHALVCMGQIRFFANKCGISNVMFNKIFWEYYSEDVATVKTEPSQDICFNTGYQSDFARNRILFGAPGTGKSFTLNKEKDKLLSNGGEYERVTFHPDYSYAGFVGTYKPVPSKTENGQDAITYRYVPGPFMRTYVKALLNSRTDAPKPFLLVIEEINRANVAAVFGDVFQLLDRGDDNVSEYAIQASEDIKKYLAKEIDGENGKPEDYAEIRIPDNMFIWATMNSADQGVFPMDTAFKRRWDFTYLSIDSGADKIRGKKVVLGKGEHKRLVEWNALREAINEELINFKINEDKLMGPFFLSKKVIPEAGEIDQKTFIDAFKNKVIMYLFDDAAKQKRPTLFGGCEDKSKNQYSKICAEFEDKGVFIFCDAISSKFIDTVPEDDGK